MTLNDLDMIGDSQIAQQTAVIQEDDAITRYLVKGRYSIHNYLCLPIVVLIYYLVIGLEKSNPRIYWKEHEHEFPTLAKMTRDILSISASGAGIEHLFNCARDICYYHWGQLKLSRAR